MRRKHYKISVVIPFHNVKMDVFEKGIESLRSQTFGFENIELIVDIQNCAPEYRTGVHEMLDGQDHVIVMELDNDRHTPSSPRNAGLAVASGDYVGFLDADDCYTPGCIETVLESIKRNCAQIAVFRRADPAGGEMSTENYNDSALKTKDAKRPECPGAGYLRRTYR